MCLVEQKSPQNPPQLVGPVEHSVSPLQKATQGMGEEQEIMLAPGYRLAAGHGPSLAPSSAASDAHLGAVLNSAELAFPHNSRIGGLRRC
jgi:hypothetical protein